MGARSDFEIVEDDADLFMVDALQLDSSVIAHDENVDPDPENSMRSERSREERRAEVADGLAADGGGVLKEVRSLAFSSQIPSSSSRFNLFDLWYW